MCVSVCVGGECVPSAFFRFRRVVVVVVVSIGVCVCVCLLERERASEQERRVARMGCAKTFHYIYIAYITITTPTTILMNECSAIH